MEENTNVETSDFLDRMEQEGKELDIRIEKGNNFLLNTIVDENFTQLEHDLLQAQLTAMATYSNILLMRVNNERTKRERPTIARF